MIIGRFVTFPEKYDCGQCELVEKFGFTAEEAVEAVADSSAYCLKRWVFYQGKARQQKQ